MSILVSQRINTLLFICGDNEVNVVDVYDNFLHCHNHEFNYDCMTLYIGPPLTNQTKVQGFTHDIKFFPGS